MLLAERLDQIANSELIVAMCRAGVSLCLLDFSEREPRLPREARRRQLPLCLLREFDSRLGVTSSGGELAIRGERSRALDQRQPVRSGTTIEFRVVS